VYLREGHQKNVAVVSILLCVAGSILHADQDKYGKFEQERAQQMLRTIESDLKKSYYDPNFHGLDVSARFHEAEQKIQVAKSMNEALSDIAGALLALDDSHTFFLPPPRPYTHDYGWQMKTVGDSAVFVTAVRPGTDAQSKGVQAGDQVMGINKYETSRENLWTLLYLYNVLRPQPSLRLALRTPSGSVKELVVQSQEHMGQRFVDTMVATTSLAELEKEAEDDEKLRRPRFVEYGQEGIICRLSDFKFNPDSVNDILDRFRTRRAVIIDLRGNPGGYVVTEEKFLGGFFDHDIKVADRRGRKELKPSIAKSRGGKTVTSKIVVLIDGGSASAAELFARVVQIEKRGMVIGDRSSGSVMEAKSFNYTSGISQGTFYGASITEADLVMADGKSLEKAA
jgi:C-terminal processing protease CtpA/Prc